MLAYKFAGCDAKYMSVDSTHEFFYRDFSKREAEHALSLMHFTEA